MPKNIPITLSCGNYESVRALQEGIVSPEGIDLTLVTDLDASTRNWRFLRKNEFDAAEVSSVSYMMARDQGLPLEGIPVFLHRRFRHGFAFINATKGIQRPADLVGRKVGIKSMQVSAILWMRGILEHEYNVPLAWYREAWEEQQNLLGDDPWKYGLTAQNRKTLDTVALYAHEQGLVKRTMPADELFLDVTEGRKRGRFRV